MAKNEFQIGDVVKLKSGSPDLIVVDVDNHIVRCIYWNRVTETMDKTNQIDYRALIKAN